MSGKFTELRLLCRAMGLRRVAAVMGISKTTVEKKLSGQSMLNMKDLYRLTLIWGDCMDLGAVVQDHMARCEIWRMEHRHPSLLDGHNHHVKAKNLAGHLGRPHYKGRNNGRN